MFLDWSSFLCHIESKHVLRGGSSNKSIENSYSARKYGNIAKKFRSKYQQANV